MAIERRDLPDVSAWEPMHLQLIAFPVQSPFPGERRWWYELTGEDPSETATTRSAKVQQGEWQGCALVVNVDLLRVTWTFAPRSDENSPVVPLATIGSFPEARDRLVRLMSPWLTETCPPIHRLGLAGKLVQRTDDHESGYVMLGRYLPAVQIDPESSEFSYRINRKAESRVLPGVRLNRLSTWTFLKGVVRMRAEMPDRSGPAQENEQIGYACSLDFDINTPPERTSPLPAEQLPALLAELVEHATGLAARGDV